MLRLLPRKRRGKKNMTGYGERQGPGFPGFEPVPDANRSKACAVSLQKADTAEQQCVNRAYRGVA